MNPPDLGHPVVKAGEFVFAAVGLEHGHIDAQCSELIHAGGVLRYVFDSDPAKISAFSIKFPGVVPVDSIEKILDDAEVRLVTSAAIPCRRAELGWRVMEAGRDFLTAKPGFTTVEQLKNTRAICSATGGKYMINYSERLLSDCAQAADQLIAEGAIGRVVQVTGFGPHRLNQATRPDWFFDPAQAGGILTDVGSHQVEQILHFGRAAAAEITSAFTANYATPEKPLFRDFGEASLVLGNGVSGHFRVDWLTPRGLGSWGDGRTFILGTKGYLELRKYIDIARENTGDHLYLVNERGEEHIAVKPQAAHPFFGQLILDCLNRTEFAMSQAHAFKASELALECEAVAAAHHRRRG